MTREGREDAHVAHSSSALRPEGQVEPRYPPVNISATEERLIVRAELCQEDISGLELAVTGTSLVIRGYRDTEPSGAEVVYHRRERGFGQFHRVVNLPVKVDESGAEAFYRHGVLTIVLPRLERQKARRIAVRAARKKEA